MTKKEIYAEWVKGQETLPLFMQPWWMDAVCAGKEWDVLLYPADAQRPEEVLAAMPVLKRKRWWMRYIVMPQQTQIGGIWKREVGKDERALNDSEVAAAFAEQLKALKLQYYYQQYPIGSIYPALMHDIGFHVKERVTYRIDDLSNLDQVIDRFSKNKKRQLQKALSLHAERGKISAEEFYQFHTNCLLEQRKRASYSREFLLVLERKTRRNKCSEIITIHNADGELYAAAFVVWDKKSLYYLIPTYSHEHRESGASALLVLEAIKFAREKGVAFDFEGSMLRGVASHYKQFGPTPTRYYSVRKYYNPFFRLAIAWNYLREWRMR